MSVFNFLSSLVLLSLTTIINNVVVHAQEAMMDMENVIEFDVTGSSTVQFQCTDLISDPDKPFNPRCEFRLTSNCESWTCSGSTNQMTYCDSEFFIPGRESDSYRLTQCEEGSTARCDGTCTCVTGTINPETLFFEPDGGNCEVVSDIPGETLDPEISFMPSDLPSLMPSTAPSEGVGTPPSTVPPPTGGIVTPSPTSSPPTSEPPTESPPPSGGTTMKVFTAEAIGNVALAFSALVLFL
eukprot:CAMPEP_0113499258 /NCGR_PEP_ID=MMETSP0014_2-20120614/31649_1 /TAXON_ID=2857 /ORGANISM="Nitzschia sp." /LENGTH=239 /DNA_ID=CAMNT_0000393415 /DNA_START=89 /DNA_END=808 /DNA_ORIENTATION=- /assembly_acc=CAM_ASM_000159